MRCAAVGLVVFLLWPSAVLADGPPKGMPPPLVEVAPVVSRPVAAGRTFVGTVEPSRRSVVGSQFAGLVAELHVREGDRVGAGTPLATLDLETLKLRIAAAQAQLEGLTQELEELKNGARPEELAQARAVLEQLEADLELKLWKEKASRRLFTEAAISEDELKDATLAVRAATLLRDASKASYDLVTAGPRKEKIAEALAAVQRQEAEVKRLELEKVRSVIKAPFAGYVVREYTEVGQWLGVGSPVAEVVALAEVDVTVDVVEDFIGRLAEGMAARVEIEALGGRVFDGTIHKIVAQADLRGRTFPVKIRITNEALGEGLLIKGGMFAQATISVGKERPGLFVPKDAINLGGPLPTSVWVVGPKGMATLVPVKLGVPMDDLVEVEGPLERGMNVIVKGNERIPVMPIPVNVGGMPGHAGGKPDETGGKPDQTGGK